MVLVRAKDNETKKSEKKLKYLVKSHDETSGRETKFRSKE
jgi:hypothetical protein